MASELLSCADLDATFSVLVIATQAQLSYELGVCYEALHTLVLQGLLSRFDRVTLCGKVL